MWIFLALVTAIVTSINAIIFKKLATRVQYLGLGVGQILGSMPFLALSLLWYWPVRIEPLFWVGLLGTSFLNVFATVFVFRAITLEDISFLAPIAAFNPLLTLFVSFIALGEYPSLLGIMGIVLIGFGATLLGREEGKATHLGLMQFFRKRGVRLTLAAQGIWAVTPAFEKIALQSTNPENPALLAFLSSVIIPIGMIPFMYREKKKILKQLTHFSPVFLFIGFISTLSVLAAFTAYLQTNLGYVAAIFRMNIFFTMILAALFLKEKIDMSRLGAVIFMFVGVLLLAL